MANSKNTNTNKNKRCIILARVSTSKQDYEAQIWDLKRYASTFGFSPEDCYDIANKESGFKTFDKREGFKEVMNKIESNEGYDTIICTELSRLSRNETVLHQIKDYLVVNKIQLIVKDSNFILLDENKSVNSQTELVFAIFASLAKEDALRLKRFLRKRNELNSKGYSLIGKCLFGYDRVLDPNQNKNTYQINKKESLEIQDVYKYYLSHNIGIRDLTLYCIKKGYSDYLRKKRNVTKLLSEEAYTGYKKTKNKRKNAAYWIYGEKDAPKYVPCSTEMKYPQIISKSLFESVQQKKKDNRINVDKSNKHISILSKLIKCESCGRYLTANYRYREEKIAHSYRCSRRREIDNCECKSSYSMPLLDSVVWCFVRENVTELVNNLRINNIEEIQSETNKSIDYLKEELQKLEEQRKTETNIYRINAKFDTNGTALLEYENKVEAIETRKKELENEIERLILELNNIINLLNRDLQNEINQHVSEIENDKGLLYKYIHELVDEIRIKYNDKNYMVLEIDSYCFIGTHIQFSDEEIENTLSEFPKPKSHDKAMISYYIIISKSNGRLIKVRYLYKHDSLFEKGFFYSINENKEKTSPAIPLESLFGYEIDKREEIALAIRDKKIQQKYIEQCNLLTLQYKIEEIPFRRLEVYTKNKN